MAKSIRQRRHENKTDYKLRLNILKSGKPRLVVRKTNRYIIAQIVESDIAQDKVLVGTTSKALLAKGWPENLSGSLKSIQAAYLTGLLIGKMAKEKKIKEAILDIGMQRNIKKSRIYAVLKGAVDAGLQVPHGAEALPSESQMKANEKLSATLTKLSSSLK